jgi:hypothetical protein
MGLNIINNAASGEKASQRKNVNTFMASVNNLIYSKEKKK